MTVSIPHGATNRSTASAIHGVLCPSGETLTVCYSFCPSTRTVIGTSVRSA